MAKLLEVIRGRKTAPPQLEAKHEDLSPARLDAALERLRAEHPPPDSSAAEADSDDG